MYHRLPQILFIVSLILFSWLMMQVIHETGHVLMAWQTGAKVGAGCLVSLDVFENRSVGESVTAPVYWGGAILGVLFPTLLAAVFARFRIHGQHLLQFFAGFCLVANGAYLGGDFSEVGPTDAGLLMEHGAARYQLVVFGIVSVLLGLFLWHGQSKHFGFGQEAEPVSWQTALTLFLFLLIVVILESTSIP